MILSKFPKNLKLNNFKPLLSKMFFDTIYEKYDYSGCILPERVH
jgi:hypothetical protein